MSIFSKKPTLEQRLQQAETDLATSRQQLADMTAERDAAIAERDASNSRIAVLETELSTANTATGTANGALTVAESALVAVRKAISEPLQLTDADVASLESGSIEVIATAIETIATRRAVDIAAGQGVLPVPKNPAASDGDELKEAFALAAAEPDPRKRASLFAKASKLVSGDN